MSEIKKQIKQQISDVDYDFKQAMDRIRMTQEEREKILGYWSYLSEITEELNNKNN